MLAVNTSEQIKKRVDEIGGLPRLAEMIGIRLSKSNRRTAHCPNTDAHTNGDKTASLSFTSNGEGFKCHGCGGKGDAFELYRLAYRCDFKTALYELASLLDIDVNSSKAIRKGGRYSYRKQPEPAYQPKMNTKGLKPDLDSLRLHGQIWSIVKNASVTPQFADWIASRSLSLPIVRELGWRSWFNSRDQILDTLKSAPRELVEKAGYLRDGKLWNPLKRLTEDTSDTCCFIPAFHPEHKEPTSFRYRAYSGGKYKSMNLYGQMAPPMGLSLPDGGGILEGASGHQVVLVVEGEPDWASLSHVFGPQAGVVCLTNVASGWPEAITSHLSAAKLIVMMTHDKHGEDVYTGLFTSYSKQYGKERAEQVLRSAYVSEGDDLNDQAKRGDLDANLSKVSELITRVIQS